MRRLAIDRMILVESLSPVSSPTIHSSAYLELREFLTALCMIAERLEPWRDYTLRMLDTLDRVGAGHYIKKDLRPFLPPGYQNPLRVPQHH
jgi:hypothetical protein